jgi:hypothetical protein
MQRHVLSKSHTVVSNDRAANLRKNTRQVYLRSSWAGVSITVPASSFHASRSLRVSQLQNAAWLSAEEMFNLKSQKCWFAVPAVGTPHVLHYFRVARGKGQRFSNAQLCGWWWLPWGWELPWVFPSVGHLYMIIDRGLYLDTKLCCGMSNQSKQLCRNVSLLNLFTA